VRKPTRKPSRPPRVAERRKPARAQLIAARRPAERPTAVHPVAPWANREVPFTDGEYRKLYDFAPVNWMVLDGRAVILDISLAGSEMLGAATRFLAGTPLLTLTDTESRPLLLDHMRRCRNTAEPVETELMLRNRQGARIAVRLYTRRLLFVGTHLYPTAAIDITEQRATERARQLAEAERDRAEAARRTAQAAEAAKDRLIAVVSHELRNPLSPALLAAVSLQQMADLPERAKAMAAMIRRNIELEARLIDDLLDVARAARGQLDLRMGHVDLHDILRQAVHVCAPAAAGKSVTIADVLTGARPFVRGDAARLQQVFWNLISNAVKFSPRGGQVIVRTTCDKGDIVRVSVRDFGSGMDEETVNMLFSPFERPRAGTGVRSGLGVGLTIAKSIVDAHGGRIWGYSEGPERGSLFEVELAITEQVRATAPAVPAPDLMPNDAVPNDAVATGAVPNDDERTPGASKRREQRDAAPRPEPDKKGRLLIVEDHLDTGATLAACLEEQGYDVRLVRTVAAGIQALNESWDAILSDIDLTDGSGLDIARAARARFGQGPQLIAVSGFGMIGDIQRSRDAGFDAHLVKPVTADEVVRLLEQIPATR
jgi:PAS domain S-box-containing protein